MPVQPSSKGKAQQRLSSAVVETLENRQLLSVAILNGILTMQFNDNVNDTNIPSSNVVARPNPAYNVRIYRDPGNPNTLVIHERSTNYVRNAAPDNNNFTPSTSEQLYTYDLRNPGFDVKRVVFRGGPGNDSCIVDESSGKIKLNFYMIGDLLTGYDLSGGDGVLDANFRVGDSAVRWGDDTLIGGAGNDVIYGNAGKDQIKGKGGKDYLHGYGPLIGVNPAGTIVAGTVYGGLSIVDGDDIFDGGAGSDAIYGGDGQDILIGNTGNDWLEGGAGQDTLSGWSGNDTLICDRVGVSRVTATVLNPGQNDGPDLLQGDTGRDSLFGNYGNDTIQGGDGGDFVFGGAGSDYLLGGLGNDELWGEFGNDTLQGDDGADSLCGGAGSDVLGGGTGYDLYSINKRENSEISDGSGSDSILVLGNQRKVTGGKIGSFKTKVDAI